MKEIITVFTRLVIFKNSVWWRTTLWWNHLYMQQRLAVFLVFLYRPQFCGGFLTLPSFSGIKKKKIKKNSVLSFIHIRFNQRKCNILIMLNMYLGQCYITANDRYRCLFKALFMWNMNTSLEGFFFFFFFNYLIGVY